MFSLALDQEYSDKAFYVINFILVAEQLSSISFCVYKKSI